MANTIRSAKDGKDWTSNELLAYNITVSYESPDTFYGMPLPTVESLGLDPNLLSGSTLDDERGISEDTFRLLRHLEFASTMNSNQASSLVDFTREILGALGYQKRGVLRFRHEIPLICGDSERSAQIDVSLIRLIRPSMPPSPTTVLLVIKQDTTTMDQWPDAQVIADAIAAFQWNNYSRTRSGLPELGSMTIPCIGMVGTRPIFYLVPVTRELSHAVAKGQYPPAPTVVKSCVVASKSSEGMESPDFRQLAFQHFVAFYTLAETHWSAFDIVLN
ncbi:hypothetical protein DFH94DRAFT_672287 [Russula ochroleuca]|jgi:hypothetical protein|uniref:Uncharacterized protein n=1 Tax=Russula ochroleuca TaxID=152965 RepID=A0A9P5T6L1_9AGAM|nr:hypothetical protein DFH94DRAFT_672287 [Russula ochroleuca]